jgi:predicted transposase YdaD
MDEAVKWCIGHDILKGFLKEHGTEVMNMLMAEWKLEDALVVEREEGREEGLEQGLERGLEQGLEQGHAQGRKEGQNMILELIRQGYSVEQIEAKLAAGESSRTETAGK